MEIADAVVIVTGASSGIGAAAARQLAERGARLVLAARRAERIASMAETLGATAVPTDVTDPGDVDRLVAWCLEVHGRVDGLVNSAGQGLHVPVEQLEPTDLAAVFDLNVLGCLRTMRAVLPAMRAQGSGSIVNVSSATSLRVVPGLAGYAATKAALDYLSLAARAEWAEAGITVSVVHPGLTATEFHDRLRAGSVVSWPGMPAPDAPDRPAAAVLYALEHGDAQVLPGDPPRVLADDRRPAGGRPGR